MYLIIRRVRLLKTDHNDKMYASFRGNPRRSRCFLIVVTKVFTIPDTYLTAMDFNGTKDFPRKQSSVAFISAYVNPERQGDDHSVHVSDNNNLTVEFVKSLYLNYKTNLIRIITYICILL